MSDSNPVASTLFRFINFRNPEPKKSRLLISNVSPRGLSVGPKYFETALANGAAGLTRRRILMDAATKFTGALKTADEVIALSPTLDTLGAWILFNKETASVAEAKAKITAISSLLTDTAEANLWDNLYYQIITKASVTAKQAIMNILLANHIVRSFKKEGESVLAEALFAKIEIPESLFGKEVAGVEPPQVKKAGINYPSLPTGAVKRQLAMAKARLEKQGLKKLLKELEAIERDHGIRYRKAYNAALKDYEGTTEPILKAYRDAVAASKSASCATRPVGTTYDAADPCQQPEVVEYPKLPAFEFSFEPVFDKAVLEDKLSAPSKVLLSQVLNKEYGDTPQGNTTARLGLGGFLDSGIPLDEDTSSNPGAVYGPVQLGIEGADGTLHAGPKLPFVIGIGDGGTVTVPIDGGDEDEQDTTTTPDNGYGVCTVSSGLEWAYTLYVTKGMAQKIYKVVINQKNKDNTTQTYTVNAPYAIYEGEQARIENVFTYLLNPEQEELPAATLSFDLYLLDGSVKSITEVAAPLEGCVSGVFENLSAGQTSEEDTTYTPTGFGVKQIGIADYLKVEQTVHCYVEGEVSHIENIMAREYKEKATRRLARTEETTTSSSESEREQLTDTTTTDRFEMHNEATKAMQESQQLSGSLSTSYSPLPKLQINAGLSYGTTASQDESSLQAITKAQEITQRAMERVVSRVKEERIRKVVEEYEENNKHGFDNRQGDQHVTGVYRWVDKLYKNQVFNYGRRLMFEFMIPEPARKHLLGMTTNTADKDFVLLTKPVDPRKVKQNTDLWAYKLTNYKEISDDTLKFWSGMYNVEIEAQPQSKITVGKSFNINLSGGSTLKDVESNSGCGEVEIPEGYNATRAIGIFTAVSDNVKGAARLLSITVGNKTVFTSDQFGNKTIVVDTNEVSTNTAVAAVNPTAPLQFLPLNYGNKLPVSYTLGNHIVGDITVTVTCELSTSAKEAWQIKAFNAIMAAYEEAVAKYNEQLEKEGEKAAQIKASNPGFYREIENRILKQNCISYLVDQNPLAKNTYGKEGLFRGTSFTDTEVNMTQGLDDYAAFVKFMEQAFEWNIMSYTFYPYYWASREKWAEKYQFDDSSDPLYRNFIQSGMAQVIVTVNPGFEEAVYHYLQTGEIWSGGPVPVVGDPLYRDIISQVRLKEPVKVGDAWITRIPTDLTILQAGSIGLEVTQALPCNCGDPDILNPETLPCGDNIQSNSAALGGLTTTEKPRSGVEGYVKGIGDRNIRIELQDINGLVVDVTYTQEGEWKLGPVMPGKYVLVFDTENLFPESQITLIEGVKERVIYLHEDKVEQVNLAFDYHP